MPRASAAAPELDGTLEAPLLPAQRPPALASGSARRKLWFAPPRAAVAALAFVLLEAASLLMVRRLDYRMQQHGREALAQAHTIVMLASPALRLLILGPPLVICSFLERRDASAGRLAALEQRIATNIVVSVPSEPVAVPVVAILVIAGMEVLATYGLAVATGAEPSADAVFAAAARGWVSMPIVLGLSVLFLSQPCQRGHLAAAAVAAVGVAVGVVPQMHSLASSTGRSATADTAAANGGVGSASLVGGSVSTAVGMVGVPFAFAVVLKQALLSRPCSSSAETDLAAANLVVPDAPKPWTNQKLALSRFALSLAAWEALFMVLMQAAVLPVVYGMDHAGALSELPGHLANSTRCLLSASASNDDAHDGSSSSSCHGVGLIFVAFALTEAGSRLAGYALIRCTSASAFTMVSMLVWPSVQLLSAWHLALGDATVKQRWRCDSDLEGAACVLPFGPFDVTSVALCAAALVGWCATSREQAQYAATAAAAAARSTGGDEEDEMGFDEVVFEVVGLHRKGMYCLAVMLIGIVALVIGLISGWIGQIVALGWCLLPSDRCIEREIILACVGVFLPLLLLSSAILLRWQTKRWGEQRRRVACASPGAIRATLHVYDWSYAHTHPHYGLISPDISL